MRSIDSFTIMHGPTDSSDTPLRIEYFGTPQLPKQYSVIATPSQECAVHVPEKSSEGFVLVLTPIKEKLKYGAVDIIVAEIQ